MRYLSIILLLSISCGCESPSTVAKPEWHRKHSWKADFYFRGQPQVIELCMAIEVGDLAQIDRLVEAGVDVNSLGVSDMTPLMWAYPAKRPEVFVRLLEHGADPNVAIKSDLNTQGALHKGDSVTYLATMNRKPIYFDAVFEHGGDPDFVCTGKSSWPDPLIAHLIKWGSTDKVGRIDKLISCGANLDLKTATGGTLAGLATSWGGQYPLALQLLEGGADPFLYQDDELKQLEHVVLAEKNGMRKRTPQQETELQNLMQFMEEQGVDFDEAQADLDRWASYGGGNIAKLNALLDREIIERKRREQRKRAQSQDN